MAIHIRKITVTTEHLSVSYIHHMNASHARLRVNSDDIGFAFDGIDRLFGLHITNHGQLVTVKNRLFKV